MRAISIVAAALVLAAPAAAHSLTATQAHVLKHRFQLSTYKVAAYEGRWHWLLRPSFQRCSQIRFAKPRGRCFKHREGYRFHRERMERLHRILWPPQATVTSVGYWASKQIAAATVIGRESGGDPWPNCPDPYDGSGSWFDTVACENGGNWLDSPGYFRCGLQFEPAWERRFGRLCP